MIRLLNAVNALACYLSGIVCFCFVTSEIGKRDTRMSGVTASLLLFSAFFFWGFASYQVRLGQKGLSGKE